MRIDLRHIAGLALFAFLLIPAGASAQAVTSITGGPMIPTGDFADEYNAGYGVRFQAGVKKELGLGFQAQVGFSSFTPDLDVLGPNADREGPFHLGLGARQGFGEFWIGATAAYFFSDQNNDAGILPEIGMDFGPFDVVAEMRLLGDQTWFGIRGGVWF